jgi:hypothetical protein
MYRFCYEKVGIYAPILYMLDQANFDFMIQDFKIVPDLLVGSVYATHPTNFASVEQAKIIHSWG